jgi:putative effector of murein hydrolase
MMHEIWWSLPLTLIVFFLARKLAARFKFPLLNPLLVAMVVIIPFLLLTGISYERYFAGSKVLNDLLQPAVVALAFPLYEQLRPLEIYHYHLLYRQLRGDDHRHHRRSADGRHAANRRLYSA